MYPPPPQPPTYPPPPPNNRDSGGCLYTGGAAWLVGDEIFYTTARTARNTRAYTGIPEQLGGDATLTITNFKGYLCNIGIVHWGLRAALRNIEIYDSNRLATLLGYSTINNAIVNANTGNPVASRGFPIGNRWDNPPQTGFQWYDTWTTTFLTNVTFVNFKANPSLGYFSPTIFWTITWYAVVGWGGRGEMGRGGGGGKGRVKGARGVGRVGWVGGAHVQCSNVHPFVACHITYVSFTGRISSSLKRCPTLET